MKKEEKYCGACCWFKCENTDGFGLCMQCNKPIGDIYGCSHICHCGEYVSEEQKRHYMAVMLQYTRWVKNEHSIDEAFDGDELDRAIKFAYNYLKTL